MHAYIVRRLLLIIPTVFLVSFIVFFIIRLIPGGVIDVMVSQYTGWGVGMGRGLDRAALEHSLGLDVPVWTQYGRWVGFVPQADGGFEGILQGSLGTSLRKGTPVTNDIIPRLPVTLELGLLGVIVAQIVGLPIGIYSALRQDTWRDYMARSLAILCIAVPGFWVGTMVMVFPAIWWGYMPPTIYIPFTEDPLGNLKQFIVPAIVLGMAMSGVTMRMTRTMMLEVLRQDYIRTAWAKGLRERVVVLRHALKNALIPVVTVLGINLGIVIGGTVIIEQIFGMPGMGRLLFQSVTERDYTVVSGVVLCFAVAIVLINLIVDLTYSYLDPRVCYE